MPPPPTAPADPVLRELLQGCSNLLDEFLGQDQSSAEYTSRAREIQVRVWRPVAAQPGCGIVIGHN